MNFVSPNLLISPLFYFPLICCLHFKFVVLELQWERVLLVHKFFWFKNQNFVGVARTTLALELVCKIWFCNQLSICIWLQVQFQYLVTSSVQYVLDDQVPIYYCLVTPCWSPRDLMFVRSQFPTPLSSPRTGGARGLVPTLRQLLPRHVVPPGSLLRPDRLPGSKN